MVNCNVHLIFRNEIKTFRRIPTDAKDTRQEDVFMGAYQLKITMKGSKPPIWRRILIPEGITFQQLYRMIQTAFCWNDDRLYQFEFRSEGVRVVPAEETRNDKFIYLLSRETIDGLVSGAKKFTCTYGPEDDRELEVQVEDPAADYRESYARVIKFKGDGVSQNGMSSLASGSRQAALAKSEEYDMSAVNERLKQNAAFKTLICLAAAYESYDKNTIMEIAKHHGLSGCSKYKKEELIKHTIEHVIDREEMRRYFLCVRDSELRLFERAAAGNGRFSPSESEEMDYLCAGGYVVSRLGISGSFLVAREVAKAYEDLNSLDFQEERARISRIGDYFRAANFLYVITPPSVILETFNKYEEKKLTQDELMHAYELFRSFRPLVEYADGCFADTGLLHQKRFIELSRMQKKVPYYIPTRQEIRSAAEHKGLLMTEELSRLSSFLTDRLNVPAERLQDLLYQVQTEIRLGGKRSEVMAVLEAQGIRFESEELAKTFAGIINDVWNHTRLVLNRGHKPHEMVVKGLEEMSVQRKNVQKIYPNNPCPCGSGKKYKKCCGK